MPNPNRCQEAAPEARMGAIFPDTETLTVLKGSGWVGTCATPSQGIGRTAGPTSAWCIMVLRKIAILGELSSMNKIKQVKDTFT